MAQRSSGGGGGLLVVLLLVGLLVGKCGDDDAGTNTADDRRGQVVMPNLIGMTAGAAESKFSDFAFDGAGSELDLYHYEMRDFSALDRYAVDDHWRVVATSPKPGQRLREDAVVRFFALRPIEIQWYKTHQRIPKVAVGAATGHILTRNGPFGGVRGLVSLRYAPNHAPKYGYRGDRLVRRSERGVKHDPRPAIPREYNPRDRLKEADTYDTLTVRTAHAGERPVMGQVLTLLLRDKPEPPPTYSDDGGDVSGGIGLGYGDDDDDFNVPGWLCPTRFC